MGRYSTHMFVVNPTIAVALLVVGLLAVVWEFLRPGLVIPAVVGSICMTLAAFSLFHRPPTESTEWFWIAGMTAPLIPLFGFLLFAARRARRNKRLTIF
jgi:membrane-bound ClpP family serine protease